VIPARHKVLHPPEEDYAALVINVPYLLHAAVPRAIYLTAAELSATLPLSDYGRVLVTRARPFPKPLMDTHFVVHSPE